MAELTTNINYLQPTGFKVVIDRKKFGNLEYFAQTISHPDVDIPAAELPFRRVNAHIAGDKLTYGTLSARIILDENIQSYTEMYDWIQRIVTENNTVRSVISTEDAYPTAVDITVSILNSKNNQVKAIRYIDCVPVSLGGIEFEATTGDIQYLTFQATFQFSYFGIV